MELARPFLGDSRTLRPSPSSQGFLSAECLPVPTQRNHGSGGSGVHERSGPSPAIASSNRWATGGEEMRATREIVVLRVGYVLMAVVGVFVLIAALSA